jgi:hypothetical protein
VERSSTTNDRCDDGIGHKFTSGVMERLGGGVCTCLADVRGVPRGD